MTGLHTTKNRNLIERLSFCGVSVHSLFYSCSHTRFKVRVESWKRGGPVSSFPGSTMGIRSGCVQLLLFVHVQHADWSESSLQWHTVGPLKALIILHLRSSLKYSTSVGNNHQRSTLKSLICFCFLLLCASTPLRHAPVTQRKGQRAPEQLNTLSSVTPRSRSTLLSLSEKSI